MLDQPEATWPLRVQFIHLPTLARLLNAPLLPYVLILAQATLMGYLASGKSSPCRQHATKGMHCNGLHSPSPY